MVMVKPEDFNDPKFMQKLKTKPSFFSKVMLGLILHWYQVRVIDDKHKDKVMCWSRQIGKSTVVAAYVVWYIFTHRGKKILIISQDRDASRRFYNMVIDMILSNDILASSILGEPLQSETRFINGTIMINKAPGRTGKSTRGDSIDLLIIDEADFIEEEVFVAAEQTTASTDGQIILISTPNKKGSTFHQYFLDGMTSKEKNEGKIEFSGEETEEELERIRNNVGAMYGFKAYHFSYHVGLKVFKPNGQPQLSKSKVDRMRKKRARWKFQQEYEAVWADDIASYFKASDINSIVKDYDMLFNGEPGKKYYYGMDFAKHVDKTVVIVGELQSNGVMRVVFIYTAQGRDWELQKRDIMGIGRRFPPIKAKLDGTGVGDTLFDAFNGVDSPFYGVCDRIVMVAKNKMNMYQNLTTKILEKRIIIPKHKPLIDELIYLQYEKSNNSEYVRINAPVGMFNIGDDYPDALALLALVMEDIVYGDFIGAGVSHDRHRNMYSTPSNWEEVGGFENSFVLNKSKHTDWWNKPKKNKTIYAASRGRKRGFNKYKSIFERKLK